MIRTRRNAWLREAIRLYSFFSNVIERKGLDRHDNYTPNMDLIHDNYTFELAEVTGLITSYIHNYCCQEPYMLATLEGVSVSISGSPSDFSGCRSIDSLLCLSR